MSSTSHNSHSKEHILIFCTHDSTRTRRTLQLEQSRFTVQATNWEEKEHMDFRPEVSAVLVENEIPDNRQLLPLCERIRARSQDVPILVTDLAGSNNRDLLVSYTPYYFAGLPEHVIPILLIMLIRKRRLLRENLTHDRRLGLAPDSVAISNAEPTGWPLNKRGGVLGKWEGPVLICRILESVLAHTVQKARDGVITDANVELPPRFFLRRRKVGPSFGLTGLTWEQVEARLISEKLEMCRSNRANAAQILGVNKKAIYNKIKLYRLSRRKNRSASPYFTVRAVFTKVLSYAMNFVNFVVGIGRSIKCAWR